MEEDYYPNLLEVNALIYVMKQEMEKKFDEHLEIFTQQRMEKLEEIKRSNQKIEKRIEEMRKEHEEHFKEQRDVYSKMAESVKTLCNGIEQEITIIDNMDSKLEEKPIEMAQENKQLAIVIPANALKQLKSFLQGILEDIKDFIEWLNKAITKNKTSSALTFFKPFDEPKETISEHHDKKLTL